MKDKPIQKCRRCKSDSAQRAKSLIFSVKSENLSEGGQFLEPYVGGFNFSEGWGGFGGQIATSSRLVGEGKEGGKLVDCCE